MGFCRLFIAAIALAALAAPLRAERTLPASVYLDRLQGMWLGEILGVSAGAPYEKNPTYVGRGGNTVTLNWSSVLSTNPWVADDDTVLEYMNLGLVYDYGISSGAQLKTLWQTYVPSGGLWCANKQGRLLMNYGFTPPDTGSLRNNVSWNLIDSQITTEALGAVAPGMRQRAADLAGAYGSVTNSGYALHAAQFYAAMYAAAPFETSVETVVAKGLEVVPVSSRSHEVIQNVVNWYQADKADGTLNWRSTQEKIYDNYVDAAGSHSRYIGWVESTVNLAMTTMAILYGQGELDPTVEIAINGGFDADCNPATAAGLVGLMKGYSGLPAGATSAANNTYQFALLQNMPPSTTITQMAAYAQAAAEREIVRMGGRLEGSGAGAIYHLPDDVLQPLVEKPDPAGPRGLVRDVRQAGGAVTASASIERHLAGYDPCNLDQITDGITDLSYNGHRPYTTYDGANAQPAGGDWYQLNFDRNVKFDSLIFHEGDLARYDINRDLRTWGQKGGYFLNLIVEIGRDGVFAPAGNLVLSEPLDPFAYYQQIAMTFDPAVGSAIRIRGNTGGTEQYTTITELEAFGSIPTPVTCSPGAEPLWNNPDNWSGGAVPGPQNIAVLGTAALRQITIGQAESVLGLDLRAAGWTIDGPGKALTVGAGGIASSGAGTSTVIPAVALSANSIWTVGTDNTLRLAGGMDGSGHRLTKAGPGTLSVSGANNLEILQIAAGMVALPVGEHRTLSTRALAIAGGASPSATLDLGDGLLAINYDGANPIGDVAAWVKAAYHNGAWDGAGITSALLAADPTSLYGIGYAENGDLPAPFDATRPFGDYTGGDDTTVLVRYTLIGDVNLDGLVDDVDLSLLTNNYGSSGVGWLGGDVFGFDGRVDDGDVGIATNNYGSSLGQLQFALPEPATLGLLALGVGAVLRRRK